MAEFPWLEELNPRQRDAVTHGDGPLLVVAGAGTGKTRTLAYRVAYLIAAGVDPGRILLLTFTRRAAEEMLRRAAAIVARGTSAAGRVWGGTFHAIGNRLLRTYSGAAGIGADFTVMDRSDAEDMLQVIRHDLWPRGFEKRFPRKSTCLAVYSRCTNGGDSLDDVVARYFPWCSEWKEELKTLFLKYVERKQAQNVLDFDDLLLYWARLASNEAAGSRIGGMFDHVLVDEYQDTNRIQAEILRGVRRNIRNIMAVGDDAQSIYGFRAAEVRNMLDFEKHFPGAAVVALEQNYRSVMPILEATNRLISQAGARYTKDLWSSRERGRRPALVSCRDEDAQDSYVVKTVLEHHERGVPLRKQAVLFRAGHLSDSLEIELTRRNIPFRKYGGLRFLEGSHVKDLISLLRIIENPRDEMAWFRALGLMDGMGPATAARVVRHVARNRLDPAAVATFKAPPAAREQMAAFAAFAKDLVSNPSLDLPAQIERARKFYDPLLEKNYENPEARSRDIENLERISRPYRSRRAFLTELQLDPPGSTSDFAGAPAPDDDYLVLSTIHSAKGCEWDVVFIIHASDGCLPSDMAAGSEEEIEEELRLVYVAMTRARDFLYVTWPLRYYYRKRRNGDGYGFAQLSRFFKPVVRDALDMETAGGTELEDDFAASGVRPRADIRGSIRDMWL